MSLTPGFRDIFDSLVKIYQFVQECHNAPRTIKAAELDCRSLEQELRVMKRKAADRNFDKLHGPSAREWYAQISFKSHNLIHSKTDNF